MLQDKQGNNLTGANAATAVLYDQAVEAFNLYRGDPVGLLDQALAETPELVMADIAKMLLLVTSTEPEALRVARGIFDRIRGHSLDNRESSYLAALELLFKGEWTAAGNHLDRHSMRYPLDLLALQTGHLIDFYCANSRNLRDRINRVLPDWSEDVPGFSILLGMQAFGLEETGDYARAEAAGRQAVALQPLDCWAHHAVTHVMEMQGRPEDGLGWMLAREPFWSADDNLFKVHNWWHRAVFHLELEQKNEALALYDNKLRSVPSVVALDLIDASALLWRLHLAGMETADRWQELADCWAPHADGVTYPFNDWHAVMAYLGCERHGEVRRIIDKLRNSDSANESGRWSRQIGLDLIEGFNAFWKKDYTAAIGHLYGVRHFANAFGGSHAQRDIIDLTLLEAALRGGDRQLARALAHERLALKPCSSMNRQFLRQLVESQPTDHLAA